MEGERGEGEKGGGWRGRDREREIGELTSM